MKIEFLMRYNIQSNYLVIKFKFLRFLEIFLVQSILSVYVYAL